jgi:hypothetical protein
MWNFGAYPSSRDWATNVWLITQIFVDQIIFATNNDSTRPITTTGNTNQNISLKKINNDI